MIGICLKFLKPFAMVTKKIESATFPTLRFLNTSLTGWSKRLG